MRHDFHWSAGYASQRSPVFARNIVATSHPLAAQAGLRMLAAGGNAVDAAVATAAVMTLVEPCSNGLGSDAFAIVWDGQRLQGLNASGHAPTAWTPEHFRRRHGPDGKGLKEVPGVRDLTDANLMGMLTDDRVKSTIRMGKPPTMPAFAHFAEPSLKVLVAYVRQLSTPQIAAGAAPQPAPAPAP